MTFQSKLIALLVVLLVAAGWDDWRRAHTSAPASSVAAAATLTAAPQVTQHETERVVTQLHCSDGTSVTQTDSRADSSVASAPVTAAATASVTPPAPAGDAYSPSRYSVRVDTNPVAPRDVGVAVGARLGNLPISVVVGGEMHSGSVSPRVGLQLDW